MWIQGVPVRGYLTKINSPGLIHRAMSCPLACLVSLSHLSHLMSLSSSRPLQLLAPQHHRTTKRHSPTQSQHGPTTHPPVTSRPSLRSSPTAWSSEIRPFKKLASVLSPVTWRAGRAAAAREEVRELGGLATGPFQGLGWMQAWTFGCVLMNSPWNVEDTKTVEDWWCSFWKWLQPPPGTDAAVIHPEDRKLALYANIWGCVFWGSRTSPCEVRPQKTRSYQNPKTTKPQNQRSQIQIRHGLSRWSPTMTSFLKGQNRPITVCHGSSRPGMLGSWDFMVLSSDNDTCEPHLARPAPAPKCVMNTEQRGLHRCWYWSCNFHPPHV